MVQLQARQTELVMSDHGIPFLLEIVLKNHFTLPEVCLMLVLREDAFS
jgi:hypothetical protein